MKRLFVLVLVCCLAAAGLAPAAVRTVVFMQKETTPGQDIFIKGGHDAGLVPSPYPSMSEPIIYNNTLNATTAAIKAADASLDWGSESALDWTCNSWPASWGATKTYAVDGYGEDPENSWGLHWWKFDVNMEGTSGEWFEFKAFMREGSTEWWESDRSQSGTPHSTINHWGKKGYITRCAYNENWVEFIPLGSTPNQDPSAAFSVAPSSGTISTSFAVDASASSDPEDGNNLQYRWDWNNDGVYDTSFSSSKTASHSFSSVGSKTIKLEVKDSGGKTDTITKTVVVNNTAPTADFSLTPTTGTTSTTFQVDASASSDLEDGSNLQYRWDWNNDGVYDTAFSSTKTASHQYGADGSYTIKLQVRDSNGATAVKTAGVTVQDGGSNPHPGYYSGKLGANLYSNGVEFSIWWRSALVDSVHVAGSFNSYSTSANPMTRITSGNNTDVWWCFVPNVQAGDQYKFVGHKHGQPATNLVWTPDPYAKYNRYSNGDSVVVDNSTFTWEDGSWQRPSWDYYIIYELHVKDFTSADPTVSAAHRGKYLGVVEKLDYLKNMGVTCIELMPISEFPDVGYGWGYNTSLFGSPESGYAVNPALGQEGVDQLKTLINEAHKKGIAVIFDMVFNHTANGDNHLWTIDNVAYFDFNNNGDPTDDQTPWGNKLNTKHPIVHRLARDVCEYYMREFHVDGFRFDATHTDFMDHDFIRGLKAHVAFIDPNVFFVMENLPNQSDLKTWGAQWAAEYRHRGKDLLCDWNFIDANYFSQHIYYTKDHGWAASPMEALNYLESHDEDTLAYLFDIAGFNTEAKRWRSRQAAVMLATSLGIPMLWMGQEFVRPREGQNTDEMPLDWTLLSTYGDVQDYYAYVFRLRRDNPALRIPSEAGFNWQYTPWSGDSNVVGYSLTTANPGDKKFVVLLNFNDSTRTVTLGFPENGTWTRVVTETSVGGTGTIYVSGNSATVSIYGNSGVIFMK